MAGSRVYCGRGLHHKEENQAEVALNFMALLLMIESLHDDLTYQHPWDFGSAVHTGSRRISIINSNSLN